MPAPEDQEQVEVRELAAVGEVRIDGEGLACEPVRQRLRSTRQ